MPFPWKQVQAGCLALAIPLCGCGNSSGSITGGSPGGAAGSVATSAGTLVLRVDPVLAKGEVEESGILQFTIYVLNSEGVEVIPKLTYANQGNTQEFRVPGVPLGRLRVLIQAEGSDGEVLGTQEVEVFVTGLEPTQVAIPSLISSGQTREIGLLSVGRNGFQGTGASHSPTISSDGRFVAFASRADLLNSGPVGVQQIFFRDRALGTLTRLSLRTNGEPFDSDCFDPDISADARFIVFRNGDVNGRGALFVRDRGTGSGGGDPAVTLAVNQQGRRPKISGDGRFVVFDFDSDGLEQITLRRISGGLVEGISRTPANVFGNGRSIKPCISFSGQFVAFHSNATDLIPGGTPGIYLRDRINLTIERLPIPANLEDTSISPDGRFILASAPGQIPFLLDRQTGIGTSLTTIGSGLVGRPSMSGDARYVSFFSNNPSLIDKDINGRSDAFVLDRDTGLISRVNVSNDGTAVKGGIDESVPLPAPAMSSAGFRVAFAAADRDLVPGGASQTDVYSASVPRPGKLYVISGNAIQRYDNAHTANGAVAPAGEIRGGSTRLFQPFRLHLDVTNDRLYVACLGNDNVDSEILVFNQVSSKQGNVVPNRVLTGLPSVNDLALDPGRNILYLATGSKEMLALSNASNLNGAVPAANRRLFKLAGHEFGVATIMLDSRLDELYFASNDSNSVGQFVAVIKASTANSNSPLRRRLFGANTLLPQFPATQLFFDTSPPSFVGALANDASLGILDERTQTSTFTSNGSRSGFLGNVAPATVVPGNNNVILVNPGTPKEFGIPALAGVAFDPTTHLRYVGDRVAHSIRVYRSSAGANTPDRTLLLTPPPGTSDFPLDIALDRTR